MIILTLLMSFAHASDQWFCKEESSQMRGRIIEACGVAVGKDENDARSKAFNNAFSEFKRICDSSDECRDHKIVSTPKRTTCDGNKCYRMIEFSIGELDKIATKRPVIANGQTVAQGMSLSEVQKKLGQPDSIEYSLLVPNSWGTTYGRGFVYKKPFCKKEYFFSDMSSHEMESGSCRVIFEQGIVTSYENFN